MAEPSPAPAEAAAPAPVAGTPGTPAAAAAAAAADAAAPAAPTAPTAMARRRSGWRWPLLIAGPLLVLGIGGYIWVNSGRYAETDNAYVKADTVIVAPAVAGIVTRIEVVENQIVNAGDVLFEIDDETYRLARDQMQSQLETVQSFIEGLQATYAQALEELKLARTNADYAARDFERESALASRGLGSVSDLDDAEQTLDTARQQIPIIEQRMAQLRAQLGGASHLSIEQHSAYRSARAALDQAEADLARTVVRAPIDGVVSHVPLAGIYAAPGTPVMSLVSTRNLWIEANFKETQLTHVAVGQPVVVRIDTYKGESWQGHVDSISPATGAEFSVIPAQNASGNWVKVAQRIPVRVRLDHPAGREILRSGMSAIVEIDTGFEREAPRFLAFLQHHRGSAPALNAEPR